MAILGLDYGAKKIGVAKSDEFGSFAMPFEIIRSDNLQAIIERLKAIILQESITKIVVGLPISLADVEAKSDNQQLKEVKEFVEQLKASLSLPLIFEDERLSSKQAGEMIRNSPQKGDDDAVAAMLILQSYLDKRRN